MAEPKHTNKDQALISHIKESVNNPLVVIFSASWHSHSDIVDIITEKIIQADQTINVVSCDADDDEDIFAKYNIDTVPSAIVIKDKKMVRKIKGTFSKKTILDIIKD